MYSGKLHICYELIKTQVAYTRLLLCTYVWLKKLYLNNKNRWKIKHRWIVRTYFNKMLTVNSKLKDIGILSEIVSRKFSQNIFTNPTGNSATVRLASISGTNSLPFPTSSSNVTNVSDLLVTNYIHWITQTIDMRVYSVHQLIYHERVSVSILG